VSLHPRTVRPRPPFPQVIIILRLREEKKQKNRSVGGCKKAQFSRPPFHLRHAKFSCSRRSENNNDDEHSNAKHSAINAHKKRDKAFSPQQTLASTLFSNSGSVLQPHRGSIPPRTTVTKHRYAAFMPVRIYVSIIHIYVIDTNTYYTHIVATVSYICSFILAKVSFQFFFGKID